MSREAARAFLKRAMEDEVLRKKLVEFASLQGYDFSADELTADDLGQVAGGVTGTIPRVAGEASDDDHGKWTDLLP